MPISDAEHVKRKWTGFFHICDIFSAETICLIGGLANFILLSLFLIYIWMVFKALI
jgi:hypothetical protein